VKILYNGSGSVYVEISTVRLCDKLTLIAKGDITDTKLLQPSTSTSPSAAAKKAIKYRVQ